MSLLGESSLLLKHTSISGENFSRVWEALVTRYENKRVLVDSHLTAFFGTRKVNPAYSAELKRFLSKVTEALGALDALDCAVAQWDPVIVHTIVRKLDIKSFETIGNRKSAHGITVVCGAPRISSRPHSNTRSRRTVVCATLSRDFLAL